MLESQSRALKRGFYPSFQKYLSQKISRWIGDQDQVNSTKNAKTPPLLTSRTKNPNQKLKIVCSTAHRRISNM